MQDVIVVFLLVKEKLGCGFLVSSLLVWSRNYFLCIFILVSYCFHTFDISIMIAMFALGQLYPGRWGCHLISVVCTLLVSLALYTSLLSLLLYNKCKSS